MSSPGTAPAPTEGQPAPASGAFMPVASLRRHWRLSLAVVVLVAGVGMTAAWFKGNKFVYSATATLYVAPRFVNILQDSKDLEVSSYQQFRQFIEQQALTVGRYDILLEALRRLGEKRGVWQAADESDRRAAERLQAALKVVAVKDSYLITVSLESSVKDGLDEIVNAVVETFIEKVKDEEFFHGRKLREAELGKRRGEVVKQLAERSARRTEIAQTLGVTTFSDTSANPFDQLLIDAQTALAQAQRERIAAASSLAVFEDERGNLKREALDAAAFDFVSKDATLNTLKGNVNLRRTKLLEEISGLDEAHPLKKKIDRELKEVDEELVRGTEELNRQVGKALLEQRKNELAKALRFEQDLGRQIETHRQKAAWFATLYNEALSLGEEIQRLRKQIDAIDNRLDYFDVESKAPGFIRSESLARPPETPVSGGRKKPMGMAFGAALLLGLIVPLGLDMGDRRIKTANQAHKILGYPPLAALLEPSEALAVRRVAADQKRRLAIALEREHRQRGTRLILLTSVRPAAGVGGLAFDLALEFADLGVHALVVEANALKPDARYEGALAQVGLLDLLVGAASLDEAVAPAQGFLPERIGVGLPARPHLFDFKKLRDIFAELQTRYDIVLLDAPPVLLSADTEFLASMADLTLLLIGAGQVLPGELRRAAGILQKADPPAVSFIVTHLQIYLGGGYFAKTVEEYNAAEAEAAQILRDHPLNRPPT